MLINENSLITFGKYKFTALKRVPAEYLVSIRKQCPDKDIAEWIEANLEQLKSVQYNQPKVAEPAPVMPCQKYCYLTEKEAKKERIT